MASTPSSDADLHPLPQETLSKVELIWQMGSVSLTENDNELRLPLTIGNGLSHEEISSLELRLSNYLGGMRTVSFKDFDMNFFRVARMPEMQKTATSPAASVGSITSEYSTSSTPMMGKVSEKEKRPFGKKARIPRPPNAFILYRQKHHPSVKAANPDLHNNDISVILGQQWKNETPELKNKFKALAEELKRQHVLKFPDYQYAPRKPSEKKRRMTARKLAKIQKTAVNHDVSEFPTATEAGQNGTDLTIPPMLSAYYADPNDHMFTSFENYPSIEELLELSQADNGPAANPFSSDDAMNFSLDPQQEQEPLVSTDLFNSVIDWSQLGANSTGSDQTFVIQNDHSAFTPMTEAEQAVWNDEMQRTLRLIG